MTCSSPACERSGSVRATLLLPPAHVTGGMCRQCIVEVEGPRGKSLVVSCMTPVPMDKWYRPPPSPPSEPRKACSSCCWRTIPLDCPVCDKGGECPLQNQAMSVGRPESRFTEEKRTFEKPINVSAQVLLDRERCVSCARCTRFADQIAGDPMIELLERGARQQVGTAADEPFDSYFSGTPSRSARLVPHQRHPTVSGPSVRPCVCPHFCEHCASGCSLRTDYRRSTITARLAWDTRTSTRSGTATRAASPSLTNSRVASNGRWSARTASCGRPRGPRLLPWPLGSASGRADTAVLVGGRSTMEDAYAYSRFARVVLRSDNIDFRARANSAEEQTFLASQVAGTPVKVSTPISRRLRSFCSSPSSLRTNHRSCSCAFAKQLPWEPACSRFRRRNRGLEKMQGVVVPALPGDEARTLSDLPTDLRQALAQPGAVIMVGERAACAPGTLSAVAALADSTGAALAWVPRRAGERAL